MFARHVGLLGLGTLLALPAAVQAAPFALGDVFAGGTSGRIYQYDSSLTLKDTLNTGLGGFQTGMAFDSAGRLYATNFGTGYISRFNTNGTLDNAQFARHAGNSAESVVFAQDGSFYVGAADGNQDINRFAATGGAPTQAFNVAVTARGADWIDLAADQRTMFYTSENFEVKRFDLDTDSQLADFWVGTQRPLFALRIRSNGEVLVAGGGNNVFRLDSSGNLIEELAFNDFVGAFALNLDADGTSAYTGDASNGRIAKFDIETGNILDSVIAPEAVFGLAVVGELTQGCGNNCGGGGGTVVSEPASLALLGAGLLGLAVARRRRATGG